jgi:hypothetical protein
MKKQTAVEWLISRFKININLNCFDFGLAKELEKKQIIDAFEEGYIQCNIYGLEEKSRKHFKSAEQYYKETYEQ